MEKKIKELEIRNDKLDLDVKEFLKELKVTPEQLTAFCSDSSNFTGDNWGKLQSTKNELESRLEKEINAVHNPLETRKKMKEQVIGNRWLFVR